MDIVYYFTEPPHMFVTVFTTILIIITIGELVSHYTDTEMDDYFVISVMIKTGVVYCLFVLLWAMMEVAAINIIEYKNELELSLSLNNKNTFHIINGNLFNMNKHRFNMTVMKPKLLSRVSVS